MIHDVVHSSLKYLWAEKQPLIRLEKNLRFDNKQCSSIQITRLGRVQLQCTRRKPARVRSIPNALLEKCRFALQNFPNSGPHSIQLPEKLRGPDTQVVFADPGVVDLLNLLESHIQR